MSHCRPLQSHSVRFSRVIFCIAETGRTNRGPHPNWGRRKCLGKCSLCGSDLVVEGCDVDDAVMKPGPGSMRPEGL